MIEISCEEVWREISNYVDSEIDAELRARMEAHFKACAHCKAVLDGINNVVMLVGDGVEYELPQGFSQRL
jgi:anti-sigma factor RsiW